VYGHPHSGVRAAVLPSTRMHGFSVLKRLVQVRRKNVFMRCFIFNCQIEANIWFAIQLYYIEKCKVYGFLQGLVGGDTHRKARRNLQKGPLKRYIKPAVIQSLYQ